MTKQYYIQRRSFIVMENENKTIITHKKTLKEYAEEHPLRISVIASLIANLICASPGILISIICFFISFNNLKKTVESNSNSIANLCDAQETAQDVLLNKIEENFSDINNDIEDQFDTINKELNKKYEKIDEVYYSLKYGGISNFLNPTEETKESINKVINCFSTENFTVSLSINQKNLLGTSINNEIDYNGNELINKQLLFTYNDNGKNVIFLGQYDENGYWNDDCLINVYEHGCLYSITEAEYNNGKVLNYKQVFLSKEDQDTIQWLYSNRKNEGSYNSGESWKYRYINSYSLDFDLSEITIDNLITIDDFLYDNKSYLTGYYCCNTENGYFNDTTGNAFSIKFTEEGYVKYLYHGNFINGYLNDDTNEAWEIAVGYDNDSYYLNRGIFKNNARVKIDGEKPYPLTQDEINKLISDLSINFDLKWLEFPSL